MFETILAPLLIAGILTFLALAAINLARMCRK